MLDFLGSAWGIVQVILGFGFIIFAHELGHFMVAKKVGIRVERFAIGFGPKILAFTRGDTEYCIGIIPLGGYVKMAGENPEDAEIEEGAEKPEPKGDEFFAKSVGARTAVIVAGSFMNFMVAFPLCIVMYLSGYDAPTSYVGPVHPGSLAYDAGLRYGDKIVKVNGHAIKERWSWKQIYPIVMLEKGDTVFEVERGGRIQRVEVQYPPGTPAGPDRIKLLGIGGGSYKPGARVGKVYHKSPADGKFEPGDEVVAVYTGDRWRPIKRFEEMARIVSSSGGKEVRMRVKRNGTLQEVTATPQPNAGQPEKRYVPNIELYQRPTIGLVTPGLPADGKLHPGDTITHVRTRGEKVAVETWRQILDAITSEDEQVAFTVEGKEQEVVVRQGSGPLVTNSIGIYPVAGMFVQADSADGKIKRGDELVKANDFDIRKEERGKKGAATEPIYSPKGVLQGALISGKPDATVAMTFRRGGDKGKTIKAEVGYRELTSAILGIEQGDDVVPVRPGIGRAILWGLEEPKFIVWLTWKSFRLLFTESTASQHLSGPVGILTMSYRQARAGVVAHFLWLLVFISINLSIVNMLPIPILDGGHFFFLMVEKLRGRPVSDKILIRAQYVGLALLLCLMLFATFNDIRNFFL